MQPGGTGSTRGAAVRVVVVDIGLASVVGRFVAVAPTGGASRPLARALRAAREIGRVNGEARDPAAAAIAEGAGQASLAAVRGIGVAVAPVVVALVIAASAARARLVVDVD